MNKKSYESLKCNNNYFIQTLKNCEYIIMFLGTKDFLISNNCNDLIAAGTRSYNYDNNTLNYNISIVKNNVLTVMQIENLIKKYETKKIRLSCSIAFNYTDIESILEN